MEKKLSPDAVKMLFCIEEYFNNAFESKKYSSLFIREFSRLFKNDSAVPCSILGSNDAYIIRLGIIDSNNLEKNIELIENKVNKEIKEKNKYVRWFETLIPIFENEKSEGILENEFVSEFNLILKDVLRWQGIDEFSSVLLFQFLKGLKGDADLDYPYVKEKIQNRIKTRNEHNEYRTLYNQFCEWIELPSTLNKYGARRVEAMKQKLALRGQDWFGLGGFKDIETAKKIISEVFYPDQEQYYRQLEHWAKSEIKDVDCSRWISYYLWKGRILPVRLVNVLRYKDDVEKGKNYLLSKYEEKIIADKKKNQDRENRNRSFDENLNLFQDNNHNNYIEYNGDYSGTYAHDVMGYTDDEIDTIFEGDPDAYWNID